MEWDYRIVKHREKNFPGTAIVEWFGIHTVFYTDGKPDSTGKRPYAIEGMSIDKIKKDLKLIEEAFDKPILNYRDFKR